MSEAAKEKAAATSARFAELRAQAPTPPPPPPRSSGGSPSSRAARHAATASAAAPAVRRASSSSSPSLFSPGTCSTTVELVPKVGTTVVFYLKTPIRRSMQDDTRTRARAARGQPGAVTRASLPLFPCGDGSLPFSLFGVSGHGSARGAGSASRCSACVAVRTSTPDRLLRNVLSRDWCGWALPTLNG